LWISNARFYLPVWARLFSIRRKEEADGLLSHKPEAPARTEFPAVRENNIHIQNQIDIIRKKLD
jgi:hypothetical protein